jgi:hypothetical protein
MLPDTLVFASAMPSAADAEFSRYRAVTPSSSSIDFASDTLLFSFLIIFFRHYYFHAAGAATRDAASFSPLAAATPLPPPLRFAIDAAADYADATPALLITLKLRQRQLR